MSRADDLADGIDGGEGAGEAAHDDEGGAAVEDDVSAEEDPLLWEPGDDVVGGVGGADVDELDFGVAGVDGEAVSEDDVGRGDDDLAPVDVWPEGLGAESGCDDFFAAHFVADDVDVSEDEVAVGVVAVVVGVDEGADGPFAAGALHLGGEVAGAAFGEAGVDDGEGVFGCDEAGVVEAPLSV